MGWNLVSGDYAYTERASGFVAYFGSRQCTEVGADREGDVILVCMFKSCELEGQCCDYL
jgi:hypothetical protein